jgi:hypothetical protein
MYMVLNDRQVILSDVGLVITRALESIKAGRRLAESRFPGMHVAAKGQRSVAGMFGVQGVKR